MWGVSCLLMSSGAAGLTTFPFSDIAWLPPGSLGKVMAKSTGNFSSLLTVDGQCSHPGGSGKNDGAHLAKAYRKQASAALTGCRAVRSLPEPDAEPPRADRRPRPHRLHRARHGGRGPELRRRSCTA